MGGESARRGQHFLFFMVNELTDLGSHLTDRRYDKSRGDRTDDGVMTI